MCGIAGVYMPGSRPDVGIVSRMLTAMAHRGPDDSGLEILAERQLVFGHLRLSILDLSPLGHQPMASPDKRSWIVYNGEIYNFREIRAELQELGDRFISDSDTEVVLAAYRRWGLRAIERFRGMFAFALWDESNKVLHLCRDRFGVKPLYYSHKGGSIAFASEMKGLIAGRQTERRVDATAVSEFVQYGYISAPSSAFDDVQVIQPGTVVTFDANLKSIEHRYWTAQGLFDGEEAECLRHELSRLSDEAVLNRIETSLREAFAYRMVADVPVGLFLSGGIDSSLVAAVLTRASGYELKTFTIAFENGEFDESPYARQVAGALGAVHTEFMVSERSASDAALKIAEVADEPIGDSSLIPTLMVCGLARQHVKVALSADGADELFGGYARYAHCGRFLEKAPFVRRLLYLSAGALEALPPRVIARAYALAHRGGPRFAAINDKLRKFVRMSQAKEEFDAYDAAISEWSRAQAHALTIGRAPLDSDGARTAYQNIVGTECRDRFMHFDMIRYLPGDLLTKVDRASMAVSLEAREPFLDHELAKLAAALNVTWKVRGGSNKYILRQLLYRHLPRSLFERPKQGFSAPVADWLRGPLRSVMQSELSEGRIREEGLLDAEAVNTEVRRFLSEDSDSGSAAGLWILLQLQQWAGKWRRSAHSA